MKEIKKTDTISEAISKNPKAAKILYKEGLFCVGCGMAQYETIEQGCSLHGIDINKVLKKINNKKKKIIKTSKKKNKKTNYKKKR